MRHVRPGKKVLSPSKVLLIFCAILAIVLVNGATTFQSVVHAATPAPMPAPVPTTLTVALTHATATATANAKALAKATSTKPTIPNVPFFSQFRDIALTDWQQVGCGITSLAMMIDFYKPNAVSVNALLKQGIAAGAFNQDEGWTFAGLMQISLRYGLNGSFHDLSQLGSKAALTQFKGFLTAGPVILSVHNRFDPLSTVPHMVVIEGIKDNTVYYNDPAAKAGDKKISIANFLQGWKKKFIVLRPVQKKGSALSLNMISY